MKILAARRRGAAYRGTCTRKTGARRHTQEDGYILLTLILVIALMALVATTVIVPLKFEMQRDQEEEMIHRGVQYSRAIRGYYKKFGRYPTKLEDLDNTNNLKYLRKHYKDPMNKNQDFKLLHFGDPGLSLTGSIAGGLISGATPAGSLNGPGNANGSGFGGGSSAFGGGSSAFGGGNSAFGGAGGAGSSFGGSSLGGSSPGSSGVNSNGVFAQSSGNTASDAGANSQTATGEPGTASGSDSSQGTGQGGSGSGNQLIASGPIVGVESLSKKSTIREFNHKNKYNDWQFIYDPAADRGGLITTPNQPSLQALGFGTPAGQAGNSTGSPFGQSSSGQSSFGNSGGFGAQQPQQSQPSPQPPQ